MSEKQERLEKVNELIKTIASTGHKFFSHKGRISQMEIDRRGRVWFIDCNHNDRIYTHYKGIWRGFSEGGTLEALVIAFRNFITKGTKLPKAHLGPHPLWYSEGDPWDYGSDMEIVRAKAAELGLV